VESVRGRVAVVTGAASGIGLALARRFARDGARVVLADVNAERLAAETATLARAGYEVEAVPTDVGDLAGVENLAQRAVARFGAVHVVCNNAGTLLMGRTWEIDVADWRRLMEVNFWGVVNGVHTFVPILIAQGEPGYMVNTASMAGVTSLGSLAPYVASKHAIVALSEVLDRDLRSAGLPIGVSVVCPGMVATRLGRTDEAPPDSSLAPGVLSPDDVADAVSRAMTSGSFYVFTHPGSGTRVQERFTDLLAAANAPDAGAFPPNA